MSRRRLGLGLLFLYAGEIGGKLIALLVFGRLWRVLGESRYGDLEYALGLLFVANLVLDAGLAPYGAREAARRPEETAPLAGRILRLRLLLLVVVLFGLGLAHLLSPGDLGARLLILGYSLVLLPAPFLLNWAFEARGEMAVVAGSSLLRQLLFAGGVFALVATPEQILRVPMLDAGAYAIAVLLQQILLRRRIGPLGLRRDPGQLGRVLRESLPLAISSLVWALRLFAPLLGLYLFVSAAETARFGAAHRLVIALHALVWLYFVNLLPEMSRRVADPPALARLLRRSTVLVAALVLVALPLGVLLAPSVVALVYGPGSAGAARPLAILGGLLAVAFLSGHPRYALIALSRPGLELLASAAGCAVSLAGVLWFGARLEAPTAAWLLVAAELTTALVATLAWLGGRRPGRAG